MNRSVILACAAILLFFGGLIAWDVLRSTPQEGPSGAGIERDVFTAPDGSFGATLRFVSRFPRPGIDRTLGDSEIARLKGSADLPGHVSVRGLTVTDYSLKTR